MESETVTGNISDFIANIEQRRTSASLLYKVSVVYFLLPCVIFLCGFTQWYVIALIGGALLSATYFDFKFEATLSKPNDTVSKDYTWLGIFLAAMAWTGLFGAGFVGPLTGDQMKNHMIFKDLFTNTWPVIFGNMPSSMHFLSYPLGYYLAPALVAKVLGWSAGAICLYLWTALGIGLLWSWFRIFFANHAWMAIGVFILFSGLDILGIFTQGQPTPEAGTHLEWWAGWTFLQYSSNATVMSWSTQHGAAQWLLPALMFYRVVCNKTARGAPLLMSIAAFWSHLTLLGMAIFVPLVFKNRSRVNSVFKDPSLLAAGFMGIVFSFYTSKAPGSIDAGFLWDLWPVASALPKLIWFYLLEFGLLGLFIYSARKFVDPDETLLFKSTIALLLLIPLFHIGWSNDVSMRVSAIPLFILFIYLGATLSSARRAENKAVIAAASVYIIIGGFTPLNEMYRQASQIFPTPLFAADVTDKNWDRGISRAENNCLILPTPRSFEPKAGDAVALYGNGKILIEKAWRDGPFQNICLASPIKQRPVPVARLSMKFYRHDRQLKESIKFRFKEDPASINSVTTVWPQQYTGSEDSIFYKYLIRR